MTIVEWSNIIFYFINNPEKKEKRKIDREMSFFAILLSIYLFTFLFKLNITQGGSLIVL